MSGEVNLMKLMLIDGLDFVDNDENEFQHEMFEKRLYYSLSLPQWSWTMFDDGKINWF